LRGSIPPQRPAVGEVKRGQDRTKSYLAEHSLKIDPRQTLLLLDEELNNGPTSLADPVTGSENKHSFEIS
jgi:hypothetical protein